MGSRLDDRASIGRSRFLRKNTESYIRSCIAKICQILKIGLYVLRNFEDQSTSYGDVEDYGDHRRIRKLYGKPDIDKLIKSEVADKRGQLLITSESILGIPAGLT